MPFDTIGCRVAFSDPIIGDVKYDLVDFDNGHSGVEFPKFTQTYTEYTVVKEKTISLIVGGYFVVYFYFERASRQIVYLVILPTIVFVCLSFGQFFFPSDGGGRVNYCVSMLLIVVAQGIVTSEILPRSKERIWLNWFIISSQFFVIAGTCGSLIFYCLITAKRSAMKRKGSPESSAGLTDECNDSNSLDMDRVFNADGRRSCIDKMLYVMSRVDYLSMFALPLSYILFVIIMFLTVKNWDDNEVVNTAKMRMHLGV